MDKMFLSDPGNSAKETRGPGIAGVLKYVLTYTCECGQDVSITLRTAPENPHVAIHDVHKLLSPDCPKFQLTKPATGLSATPIATSGRFVSLEMAGCHGLADRDSRTKEQALTP